MRIKQNNGVREKDVVWSRRSVFRRAQQGQGEPLKRTLPSLPQNFSAARPPEISHGNSPATSLGCSFPAPRASNSDDSQTTEDCWEILARLSLWLLRALRLDGLLFAAQIAVFSLLLQHYLPPLSRYYFDRSATVLLAEDSLEQLLSADILADSAAGSGGGAIHLAAVALHPPYRTREYIVKSGENISLLARRFRLNMSTLISVNRIERAKSLKAGQKILIPNADGLLYPVQAADSLSSIAEQFETSMGALIDANELQSEKLLAGSQIFIPGATLGSYELRKVFGNLYIYPHVGRLSSRFGYRRDPFRRGAREFHNGLDIVGRRGAAVRATSDGRVVSIGYHRIYGNYVILQHAKGIKSLYGHMSRILVGKGRRVIQGQSIGRIGSSGRSTGPHVHFSIFVAGKAVNPLDYLSKP